MRGNLCEGLKRTLVRSCDRVIFVARKLCTTNDVTPLRSHSIAVRHMDVGPPFRSVETTVAGEVAIVHVLDGIVRVRCSNTDELTLILIL